MAVITIGAINVVDGGTGWSAATTFICLRSSANDSGVLTSMSMWFIASATGVKIGTFENTDTLKYTGRDYENIGSVTSGSKQTFTGLDCTVIVGDFLGVYNTTGLGEAVISSGFPTHYKSGDNMSNGEQTYSNINNLILSINGTGATATAIERNGVNVTEINGVAVVDLNI